MTAVQENALSLALIGATGFGAWMYMAWKNDQERRELIKEEKGPASKQKQKGPIIYTAAHSSQPASDLKDQLMYSSVGSKNITFNKSFIGPRGMR